MSTEDSVLERITRLESQAQEAKSSLLVAKESMEKRLDGMNEFRAAIKDYQATTITRMEHEAVAGKLQAAIDSLEISRSFLEGKASVTSVYFSYVLSLTGLFLALLQLNKH